MAHGDDVRKTLAGLELRLDGNLGCLFCTNNRCPSHAYPVDCRAGEYDRHRRKYHRGVLLKEQCDANVIINSLDLQPLNARALPPDGSEMTQGLPTFKAFKCVSCKFATLDLNVANKHAHQTRVKVWQSFFKPVRDFSKRSWTIADDPLPVSSSSGSEPLDQGTELLTVFRNGMCSKTCRVGSQQRHPERTPLPLGEAAAATVD